MPLYRVNDEPQRADYAFDDNFNGGDYVTVKNIEDVDTDGEVEIAGGGYILPSALDRVDVVEDFEGVGPQEPVISTESDALELAREYYGYVLWYRQQREQDPQVQAIADATGKDYAEAKAMYDAGLRLVGSEPESEAGPFQVGDYVTVNRHPYRNIGIPVSEFPFSGRITKKDEASAYYLVGGWYVHADMLTKEEN